MGNPKRQNPHSKVPEKDPPKPNRRLLFLSLPNGAKGTLSQGVEVGVTGIRYRFFHGDRKTTKDEKNPKVSCE